MTIASISACEFADANAVPMAAPRILVSYANDPLLIVSCPTHDSALPSDVYLSRLPQIRNP
jgi:hypothetical protein